MNDIKNYGIDGENTVKIDTRKVRVDPSINVISKEEFEDQVEKVFYLCSRFPHEPLLTHINTR